MIQQTAIRKQDALSVMQDLQEETAPVTSMNVQTCLISAMAMETAPTLSVHMLARVKKATNQVPTALVKVCGCVCLSPNLL